MWQYRAKLSEQKKGGEGGFLTIFRVHEEGRKRKRSRNGRERESGGKKVGKTRQISLSKISDSDILRLI